MAMNRRKFLSTGLGAAAATGAATAMAATTSAAPAVKTGNKPLYHFRMPCCYPTGAPFYSSGPGAADDFCKRVYDMSGGRIQIDFYGANKLIPALDGFDAVREGRVEMNWGNAYFWAKKLPAAQYFTAVPFGMDALAMNAWLSQGGGQELWDEIYEPYGLKAFASGNTGMQMTGWFRKPIRSIKDFQGLRMRIPGLGGRVYQKIGVEVKLLPGGEIFSALQRGAIDAAEYVGPYLDRKLGLMNSVKYYYMTGWHEPCNATELLINKKVWDDLPEDLQAVIRNAAAACNEISFSWCNSNNADALSDLVQNYGVKIDNLPDDIIETLRQKSFEMMEEMNAKDALSRKVHEHYFAYKRKADTWLNISDAVVRNKNL